MKKFSLGKKLEVDDIIHYSELVNEEGTTIQRGMNFNFNPEYSPLTQMKLMRKPIL